jgi:hypothetical protein
LTAADRAPSRDADRWLEMDLTWFDPGRDFEPRLDELFERIGPLFDGVSGRRGIFFNLGWLIDLVTEWQGDPAQPIPTRSRRTARWAAVSYDRLRHFVDAYREAADRHGLGGLGCGILFVEWAHVVWPPELKIYDFDSDWYDRHPELYEPPHSHIGMPDLHPVNPLRGDDYPYATAPDGLTDGTSFGEFFGRQWASFAEFTGFDAILLRDGFTGPMIYARNGPYGTRAPSDPAVAQRFSDSVRALYRDVKQAAPDRLVVGYSSAISPIADWRVGCVDFESLVADGHIDAWIEQTWGGAWQDWWHQLWKGWTFQTANLLTRRAMITAANARRERPCALWHLVETWDGWEHWDTIHQVPGKLTWGAWAFAHASALTPSGPQPSDGAYVSWLNNGSMQLLSGDDVAFVGGLLERAERSAGALEDVYGPALVYDRATMAAVSATRPDANVGEWLDDQAGLLMKWGVPVLSCSRPEWLPPGDAPRQLIAQPASAESAEAMAPFTDVAVFGDADLIDAEARDRLGLKPSGARVEADFWVSHGPGAPTFDRPYIPEHSAVEVLDDVTVHYASEHTPLVTTRDGGLWWQPTDWSEPFNIFLPKYQLGSTYPAFLVASLLTERAASSGRSHLVGVTRPLPVALHIWRSAGVVHVLLGNLETGELGDSRLPRELRLRLGGDELALPDRPLALRLIDGSGPARLPAEQVGQGVLEVTLTLAPESAAVYVVERSEEGGS